MQFRQNYFLYADGSVGLPEAAVAKSVNEAPVFFFRCAPGFGVTRNIDADHVLRAAAEQAEFRSAVSDEGRGRT